MDEYHSAPSIDLEERKQARETSRAAESNNSRIENIEVRLSKLSLITEALWDVVSAESKLSESELIAKIEGVISTREKRLGEKLTCSGCKRQVSASLEKCMYCGAELIGKISRSPFDE